MAPGPTFYSYKGVDFQKGYLWIYRINWSGWKYYKIPVPTDKLERLGFFINDEPDSKTDMT